jgi:hypothetical protein
MKRIILLFLIAASFSGTSQSKKQTFIFPKEGTVDVSAIKEDYFSSLQCIEKPVPGGIPPKQAETSHANQKIAGSSEASGVTATLSPIFKQKNFFGNPFGNSTPNDNDIAISNNCKIVSVSNVHVYFHDCVVDSSKGLVSLTAFSSSFGNFAQAFDPKVAYDPAADRFVLAFLNGFADSTSKIVLAFSQTNDPKGNWNFYFLPGNPFNNSLWSDYPMIALSQKELFLTINLLNMGGTWQTSFVESLIWQIDKNKGYAGLPLTTQLHSNITYGGANIRNICPVKGGSTLYGPGMYFLSNKNFGVNTDSVFLINISDTMSAPGQTLTAQLLNSDKRYSMPPDGKQAGGQTFATNDCRNLAAFYENNMIQYVHNTKDSLTGLCGVYHGVISNVSSPTPSVSGFVIGDAIKDYGYPNISYVGNSTTDNSSIINFNHTATTVNAGMSAVKSDALGNYSPVLNIVNGTTYVNVLTSSQERWGDYSGSQRKYNENGKVWANGYYSYTVGASRRHGTWIAEIALSAPTGLSSVATEKVQPAFFPNPVVDIVSVKFELSEPKALNFVLYDVSGKEVRVLLREYIKPGVQQFSFSMQPLSQGVYFLKIFNDKEVIATEKLIKQ